MGVDCRNGRDRAMATSTRMDMRTASKVQCWKRSRRECFREASARNRLAANGSERCSRRKTRCRIAGITARAAPSNNQGLPNPKASSGKVLQGNMVHFLLRRRSRAWRNRGSESARGTSERSSW